MDNDRKYALIIVVVNRGYADIVMSHAKAAGARGGTILYARGEGSHEAEKFFEIKISPEKEVVLILVETACKQAIMQSIGKNAGITTKAHGIVFSLPVDDVSGISRVMGKKTEHTES